MNRVSRLITAERSVIVMILVNTAALITMGYTDPELHVDVELTQAQTQQASFVISQTTGVWPGVDRQFSWDGSAQVGLDAVYPVGRLPAGLDDPALP